MKKMVSVICILGVLYLVYQFFVLFLINGHSAEYSVKTNDDSYMIDEHYKKTGDFNMYSMKITDKDKNVFVSNYNIGNNRQSQIIKDIKTYKNGNLYCIAPVFNNKVILYPSCKIDQIQVSRTYLHQIGNNEVDNFISLLKNDGYVIENSDIDVDSNISKTESNVSIYSNLDENLYTTMWGYKGVYILNNDSIKYQYFLNKDLYFNELSILCGKYYVTLEVDGNNINFFHIVNVKEGGKVKKDIEKTISKNTYINGIYKNKIYITDVDNKIEYAINPASEKIEEVGSGSNAYYYDGEKLQTVDITTLTNEKKYFINKRIPGNVIEKAGNYNYIESYGSYYYQDSDNSIYQVVGDYPEYKVLLFKFNDFKDLKIRKDNLFGISGDTVYMYNNYNGLRKIASNRELLYNFNNIFDVYYK